MFKKASLQFLGAVGTVTGSRTLLRRNGQSYLVDCGLFQGPKEIRERNWLPFPKAKELSGVFLTHAHIDHCGYLPKLIKDGYSGPVYCSEGTAALASIMLMDAAHLQEEDAEFANKSQYSKHKPALPLYTSEDAARALTYLQPVGREKWQDVDEGLSFRMIRSGHILGSSLIQFNNTLENSSRIVTFSGDLGNGRQLVIKPPVPITETDYLILESTYGNRIQPKIDVFQTMANVINRVYKRKGTLIIPAFSVGRTQEILHVIHKIKQQKLIDDIPIYLDSPMALDATEIYMKFPDELQFIESGNNLECSLCPTSYHAVKSADESMLLCMDDTPKVVLSAAGMLTGGRVLHHLKTRLPDERNAVLFVGYQVEGTKGRLLRGGLTTIRIHHKLIHVEAEVLSMDSLSAHADSDDLIQYLKQLKRPPLNIFLNHGESAAVEALRYRVLTELDWPATIAVADVNFELS